MFCIPTPHPHLRPVSLTSGVLSYLPHFYSHPVFPMSTTSYPAPLINLPKILFHLITYQPKIPSSSSVPIKFYLLAQHSKSSRIHPQIYSPYFLFFYIKWLFHLLFPSHVPCISILMSMLLSPSGTFSSLLVFFLHPLRSQLQLFLHLPLLTPPSRPPSSIVKTPPLPEIK